jgi:hypothetical protein
LYLTVKALQRPLKTTKVNELLTLLMSCSDDIDNYCVRSVHTSEDTIRRPNSPRYVLILMLILILIRNAAAKASKVRRLSRVSDPFAKLLVIAAHCDDPRKQKSKVETKEQTICRDSLPRYRHPTTQCCSSAIVTTPCLSHSSYHSSYHSSQLTNWSFFTTTDVHEVHRATICSWLWPES